mmetsp:Transcript_45624/g.90505  ORF Transcript_45624/g.90505 Transcript_45624/m.90505 type:complete len:392 (+) Transcript_45624:62-1237(+)
MRLSWSQEVALCKGDASEETVLPRSETELLSSGAHDKRVLRVGLTSWTQLRFIGLGVAALGGVACTAIGLRAWHGGQNAILRPGLGEVVTVGVKEMISEIANDEALGDDKIQIVCTVSWRAHPEKCWDYSHRLPNSRPHAGMQLSIWDCPEEPDKFMVPVKGAGPIKVAGAEKLCLDSPGGAQLQFWECTKAKKSHLEFIPNKFGMGTYRLNSRPDECIDVPNEDTTNGNRLQMWRCLEEGDSEDMHFSIHAPVHCQWSDWGNWERCSVSGLGNFEACGHYSYSRHRNRSYGVMVMKAETGAPFFYGLSKLTRTHGGGKDCTGSSSQNGNCSANGKHCVPEEELPSKPETKPVRHSRSNAGDMRWQAVTVLLRLASSVVLSIAASAGNAAV